MDAPGGKGKKKGFGESFLSTTLLAEQNAVTAVLDRGLDDDPDESGKRRLVDALQALAEDPVFRRILAATQQKVDEAYTSTGQKSRRQGSPWMDLRTQRQAAEQRRAEIGSQASESAGTRLHVEERRNALNEAQSHLDHRMRIQARLETAWQQQQTRNAAQSGITAAMAERDRVQALHDQLAEVTTALGTSAAAVKSSKHQLQESVREQEAAAATLHAARERLSGLESSKTEQARKIQKQEIDKSLLENEGRQRVVELRRAEAAKLRDLEARTGGLRAEVEEKSSTLAEAETLVENAVSQNQVDADAISSVQERLQAALILAARRDRDRAREAVHEAADLEAKADAKHEKAQEIRAEAAQLGLPEVEEVESLAKLETDLRVAEGKLRVGISVDIRPSRQIAARIRTDDAPTQDIVLTEPTSLDAFLPAAIDVGRSVRNRHPRRQPRSATGGKGPPTALA